MNNVVISLIRTYVPLAVGTTLSWLAARGLPVDVATSAAVAAAFTGVITAAYYTLARLLETKFPWTGFLLGHTAKPVYVKPSQP